MTNRPRRSALYMPAGNARAIEKARSLDCDLVILDLEDAVAPDAKKEARALAIEAARAGGYGRRELIIRVNALDTPWGADDLEAVRALEPDVGILVPKISSASDLANYRQRINAHAHLWAMIETCAAVLDIGAIAREGQSSDVAGFVVGTNDLAKEMHCTLDIEREAVKPALLMTVIAARAHGLAVLDGVFNDIQDLDGLHQQCTQAATFGFDGKTLIHPSQLATANQVFAPTAAQIDAAKAVVAAFAEPENAAKGVLKIDGRMVERLHLAEAEDLLVLARAIEVA